MQVPIMDILQIMELAEQEAPVEVVQVILTEEDVLLIMVQSIKVILEETLAIRLLEQIVTIQEEAAEPVKPEQTAQLDQTVELVLDIYK